MYTSQINQHTFIEADINVDALWIAMYVCDYKLYSREAVYHDEADSK